MRHRPTTARRRDYLTWQQVRAPRDTGRTRSLSLAAILVMAGLFLFFWVRVYVIQVGYELTQTLSQQQHLQHRHDQLRTERAMLVQPQRLETICRQQLHMRHPKNHQIVVLK